MLQEPMHEVKGGQCCGFPLISRTVFEAEGHLAVYQLQNPVVGDSSSVDVRCQVFQGSVAVAGRLTMDHPVLGPYIGRYGIEEICFAEPITELCPEDGR